MANLKKALTFFVAVNPDGTNDQVVVAFLTDPVSFVPAGVGSGGFLSSVANTAPTDVIIASLNCSLGIDGAHSSYNSLLKTLTVKFTSTGSAGDPPALLYGTCIY